MKYAALLLFFFVPASYASQEVWKAIGFRDSEDEPTGKYRFVTATGQTQAEGSFVHGRMDGMWVFHDSGRTKIAEIGYKDGKPSGKYSTYWGTSTRPAIAGILQATGHMKNGLAYGEHVAYDPDGSVWNKAIFEGGKVISAWVGSIEDAEKLVLADLVFMRMLEDGVKEAL